MADLDTPRARFKAVQIILGDHPEAEAPRAEGGWMLRHQRNCLRARNALAPAPDGEKSKPTPREEG